MIAALFVAKNGIYWDRPGIDAWDEARDARKYAGPWPVVAHPPCQLWTNLAHVNFKRYGGEHNRPGNDGGCFAAALANVRRCGGVLEHPALSHAWRKYGIPRPAPDGRWVRIGGDEWTCAVAQSAYGHLAQKLTWLFYCGEPPPDLNWEQPKGTHQIGWFDRIKPTLGKAAASATPPAFADLLISLARNARPAREAAE